MTKPHTRMAGYSAVVMKITLNQRIKKVGTPPS